ncbi:Zinc finger protein [Pseudolycoriella hygida]|uniref:Zinc finger protein n=1 Tax=Pseudolycoriella hygida TaxID=35572 RepID=A0A9Q0S8N6_9DIPT|nr:Zinc finger protein [Pseudolycoriella hygida]
MSDEIHIANFENACRFCLSNEFELSPIAKHLEVTYNKHGTSNLHHIIMVCIGITVQSDDNFPKWICSQCIYQLIESYSFREKCLESLKYLEEVKVKEEIRLTDDADDLEKSANDDEDYNCKCDDSDYVYNVLPSAGSVDKLENQVEQKAPFPGIKSSSSFRFTCDICGLHLKTLRTVAYHMKKVHIEKITNISTAKSELNPFECDICKNAYPNRKSIYRHKYRVHGLRKVKVKKEPKKRQKRLQICPICGVARREIRSHIATHSDSRDFKCDICGLSIKNAENLKRHVRRVHSEERPYPCTICNVAFKTSTHLKRHNRKHTQERNFECQYCHRTFIDAGTRDRHSILHIQERSIECEFCGKMFMTPVGLKNHIGIHTLEKKFPCGLGSCTQSFVNSSSASIHRRTHTINNLYHCSDCHVGFKELILLKMHLRKEGHHFNVE